jgi:hypothetical protein
MAEEVTVRKRTEERFYTVKSLSEHWTVTTRTVKNIIDSGELPVYRIGGRGSKPTAVRIDPVDVKSYEQRNREVRSAA